MVERRARAAGRPLEEPTGSPSAAQRYVPGAVLVRMRRRRGGDWTEGHEPNLRNISSLDWFIYYIHGAEHRVYGIETHFLYSE